MKKKKIVIALGHEALGTTLPEQKKATKRTAKAVADFIKDDYQIIITDTDADSLMNVKKYKLIRLQGGLNGWYKYKTW